FEKDGDFYIGHQGRPGVNSFYMVMHTRQMFWTPDGWPLVSSQRYATEEETPVEETELVGDWEWILFDYRIVPGYADEQVSADFQVSEMITLDQGGTINGDASSSWSYSAPWLSISYNGTTVQNLRVERGRDWENEVASTVLFTGLGDEGRPVWGKKLE
ncbi:MAG: arabinan endo-1,5-alpha-L-arabinosidase, partial [Bacteroidetes bacterium]|nr:arabinan endo-1,5-alpha-L-arabinosidase [Bacteroidota bacterium]